MSECAIEANTRNESQVIELNAAKYKARYEFVTWTDPSGNTGAAARKAVRSHAMRHCKPGQDQVNSLCGVRYSPDSMIENDAAASEDEFKIYLATMPQEISTIDPFDCLPIRLRPYMLELFKKCMALTSIVRSALIFLILTSRYNLCL